MNSNTPEYELVQQRQFQDASEAYNTAESYNPQETDDIDSGSEFQKKSWRKSNIKWLTLLLACMMLFGQYLTDDSYFYLQSQIEKDLFDYDGEDKDSPTYLSAKLSYSWIYSIYSLPNLVVPLLGGFLSDKIGVRVGNIIFSLLIFLGQLICALSRRLGGENWNSPSTYFYLLVGRFVFAMGNTIVTKWFQGNYLSLAMAVTTSLGKLGSVLGGWLLPELYEQSGRDLATPFLAADLFCLIGVITAYALNWVDKKADEYEGKMNQLPLSNGELVRLSDIKTIPYLFWLINISCVLNYVLLINFLYLSADLLHYQYQVPMVNVGRLTSIPYLMSIFLAPLFGICVDKIGHRQWILLLSTCIITLTHILWLVFPQCPTGEKCSSLYYYVPFFLMGIFYSVFVSVVWPCISLVLKDKILGTGIGISSAFINLGFFIFPQVFAYIYGNTQKVKGGYYWSSVFFIAIGFFCLGVNMMVIEENRKFNNVLGKATQSGYVYISRPYYIRARN